jgi:hypothetical protein
MQSDVGEGSVEAPAPAPTPAPEWPLWFVITIVLLVVVVVIATFAAWVRVDWDVDRTGPQGDSIAPFTALLSTLAVLVGLRSLGLQRESVKEQRTALERQLKEQRGLLERQLTEQRLGLEQEIRVQREALDQELNHQRLSELTAAYSRLISAVEMYRAFVLNYATWLDRFINKAGREERRTEAAAPSRRYEQVRAAYWQVRMLDSDPTRSALLANLTRHRLLEPSRSSPETVETRRELVKEIIQWARDVNTPARELVGNVMLLLNPAADQSTLPDEIFTRITYDPSISTQ